MRVYGGNVFLKDNGNKQTRCFMAGTQKDIARITGCTLSYIREYWGITGNVLEVETAESEPLTLFYHLDGNYKGLTRRAELHQEAVARGNIR